jgi:hypothetical protein
MSVTKSQITSEIQVVREETVLRANTKDRIAGILDDINSIIEINTVSYTPQTLNSAQKLQALNNIGAASNIFNSTVDGKPTYNGNIMAMLSDVTSNVTPSSINGNIKINGVETTIYTLPIPLSPSIIAQDSNNQFVTIGEKTNWNAASSDAHTHPNKALLDTYTQTDSNISSAISLMHSPLTIGFSNGLSLSGQQLSLSLANSNNSGALSNTDWNTFNNKVDKISNETIGGNKTFNGITTINNSLTVNGNIYQNGATYETHAQQVYTTDDLIILRDGAVSGLPSSGVTGFTAKLYDGVHDGQLVFDNTGTARVGDIGDLQPLATREETPIDQGFAYWNNASFKFQTKLLTTNDVSEGSNLYFTSGRTINSTLNGYIVGANTPITASDTILSAFEKTQGQINNLQNDNETIASTYLPLSGGTLTGLLTANSGITVNGALTATTGIFNSIYINPVTLDLSGLDQATWYPVTINIPLSRRTRMRIMVALDSGTVPNWATHSLGFSVLCDWTSNGNGWVGIPITRTIHTYTYCCSTVSPIGGISQMGNSSNEVVYIRGGGKYFFEADYPVTPIIHTTSYTTSLETISPSTSLINDVFSSANAPVAFGAITATTGNFTTITGTSFNSITGLSSVSPLMDGTATPGISTLVSRQDHVHPSDTSKLNVSDFTNLATVTKEPTGFTDPANIIETYDSVARTVTLTGTVAAYWKGVLIPDLVSGWISPAHPNTNGTWFLYYDGNSFVWSLTSWTFDMLQIAYVNYGVTNKFALRECHGMMPWQDHQEFHQTIGTYSTGGGDLSSYVLSSTKLADRRPAVSSSTIHDEDLTTVVTALPAAGPYTQLYLTSTGTTTFTTAAAEIVPVSGSQPYYNQFTGGNWVQTLMGNNSYMSIWLVAVPVQADAGSQFYRYLWMQGQTSGSLVSEQATQFKDLNLGQISVLFPEFVVIGKVIIQYTSSNWTIHEVDKLTGSKVNPGSTPAGYYLSSVSVTSPLIGNGTSTAPLSIPAATTSVNGYLTSTDWNTFNGKQAALNGTGFVKVSGTTVSYDNSTYLTGTKVDSFNLRTGAVTLTSSDVTGALTYTPYQQNTALSATTGTFSDLLTANNGLTVNVNNGATNALTIIWNGNVGIGTTYPGLAKLQVTGDIYTTGALGFYVPGDEGARNALYRGGTDFTILRNYNEVYTIFDIWAPPGSLTDREATISLIRGDEPNQEFIDIYNDGYSSETQFGIRIQKRGTGQFQDFVFDQSDGNTKTPLMILKASGNIGIGYTTDTEIGNNKLAVNGNGYFNGNIQATGEVTAYTTSDKRLKKNIKTIDNALNIINKIRPVSFNWNDKAKELNSSKTDIIEFGMIAQELEKILPNTVKNMYNGKYKGINYIQIIPYLVAAIQELTEEINILKNK